MGLGNQNTLDWFYLLTLQAFCIFVLQAALGFLSGSLELKSDLPHSAIDFLTYGFNASVEWMKLYALHNGLRFLQPHIIDEVGSLISVSVLLVMMFFVVMQISATIWGSQKHIQQISEATGPAMVAFSLVTLVSNGILVYLYKSWGLSVTDAVESPDENSDLLHGQCAECIDESPRRRTWRLGFSCQGSPKNSQSSQDKEWTAVQWIHGLLHPGCGDALCGDVHKLQSQDDAMVNLNLGAAMLHLVSDVLRTMTVLLSGFLIQIHAGAAWCIDAYGALAIAAFNILGAGTLAIKAVKAVQRSQFAETSQAA